MPDVSIIIPCFNHGRYIHEAIDSVLNQTHQNFEIIVVNDGSTAPDTIAVIKKVNHPKIKVVHTTNQGLASARNNGIREAQSEILLPLDADDKIAPTYIEKAITVLKNDRDVGIVYCNLEFFGTKSGKYILPEFSIARLLFENLIFCTAFFYRKDWEKVNGFNPNMKYSCEDWDFWLSMAANGNKVYRIPEFLFYYRMRKDSMWHRISQQQKIAMHTQVFLNHQDFFREHASEFFTEIHRLKYNSDTSLLHRLVFEKLFHPLTLLKNVKRRFDAHP
jgi:glycosyltransferase involved in cell wall biosynthesis